MAFGNPYAAYQTTAVKTASQGKLVVMLYQGLERELTSASNNFGNTDKLPAAKIEDFGKHIMKAQEIINELQSIDVMALTPIDAMNKGMGMLPDDRKAEGIIPRPSSVSRRQIGASPWSGRTS